MQVLYQLEANPIDPHEALSLTWAGVSASRQIREFTERIVLGVLDRRREIDALISKYSEHWRLERMDWVDKNILRMGVFEIIGCDDIPVKVAIDEAVDLGKKFGSEESGAFINGILDKISRTEGYMKKEGGTEDG